MRHRQKIAMRGHIGKVQILHAALPLSQHIARAAQLQVHFGNDKSVIALAQGLEPRLGGLAQGGVINQQA